MARPSTKVFAPARAAVHYALKHWDQWTEQPNWFVDTDDEVRFLLQQDANKSRTPIVSTRWRETNPEWWVFSAQEWRAPIEISVHVNENRHKLAEDLIEDAIDAVYRFEDQTSTPAVPVPYVRKAIGGCEIEILSVAPAVPIQVGIEARHRLLLSTAVLSLRLKKDPLLRRTS